MLGRRLLTEVNDQICTTHKLHALTFSHFSAFLTIFLESVIVFVLKYILQQVLCSLHLNVNQILSKNVIFSAC